MNPGFNRTLYLIRPAVHFCCHYTVHYAGERQQKTCSLCDERLKDECFCCETCEPFACINKHNLDFSELVADGARTSKTMLTGTPADKAVRLVVGSTILSGNNVLNFLLIHLHYYG